MENSLNVVAGEPPFPSDEVLRGICRTAVVGLRTRNGWLFISPADVLRLTEAVFREVKARWQAGERRAVQVMVEQSAFGLGCEQWVVACRAEGTLVQIQGYEALSHYLGMKLPFMLEKRDADLSRDVDVLATLRQEILLKVSAGLSELQAPRGFWKWVLLISRTVIRDFLTAHQRDATAYSIAFQEDNVIAEATPAYFLRDEALRERLREVLARCLQDDEFKFKIIEAFFLAEQDIRDIATQMEVESNTVSQAKFRALHVLRKCRALIEFLEDLT